MNAKLSLWIKVLMLISTALVGHSIYSRPSQTASIRSAEKADTPAKDAPDDAPPGITKGVRVQFSINQRSPFNPAKFEEGFIVEEVRGSWVRMKGEPWEGFPDKSKEISVWINFRLVEWYRVKE